VQNQSLPINLFASASNRQALTPRSDGFLRPSERLHARRLGPLLLLFALALPVYAQEFVPEHVVFPITDFKPDITHLASFSMKFGTGFCLDRDCRFVGTNYHVAKVMGKYVRIKGVFSAHRYLDSEPGDEGAQDINLGLGGSLKYTPAHDLAIYEMRHPIRAFHGIGFDADDLGNDAEVDIYAYPFTGNPKRRLSCWHGKFIGTTGEGLLAFRYEEGRVRGGASGGIVVDTKTKKIVGILNSIAEGEDRIALAVPIKELSDFVTKAQPYLQATLFPKTVFVSPVASDLYPPYVWHSAEGLLQRPVEPPEVLSLRRTAQQLFYSMRTFTATQMFAWGTGNRTPDITDAYETLIVDGWQRWRHPGTKKFIAPGPLNGFPIWPGDVWSEFPRMVGRDLSLKIHQAPDAVVGGRTIHVFQYAANIEDRACALAFDTFLFRGPSKFYDCHGEVWMDESGIILRISQALDLSRAGAHWWGVVTYGWLEKDGMQHLVPVTLTIEAGHKKTNWCRALFTDYEMFGVRSRLVLPTEPAQTQKSALSQR
jgi:hypothetical protein